MEHHEPATETATQSSWSASRRRLLKITAGVSACSTMATAGCLSDSGRATSTPEGAVENYFGALEEGDRETANRYAHEDGEYSVRGEPSDHAHVRTLHEAETIAIVELDHADMETAVRKTWYRALSEGDPAFDPESPDEIDDDWVDGTRQRERSDVERLLQNEHDFDDYAYVWYAVEINDNSTLQSSMLLFQIDYRWLIWSPRPNLVWF